MGWSMDRQGIRTLFDHECKRLKQIDLSGPRGERVSLDTYADELAAREVAFHQEAKYGKWSAPGSQPPKSVNSTITLLAGSAGCGNDARFLLIRPSRAACMAYTEPCHFPTVLEPPHTSFIKPQYAKPAPPVKLDVGQVPTVFAPHQRRPRSLGYSVCAGIGPITDIAELTRMNQSGQAQLRHRKHHRSFTACSITHPAVGGPGQTGVKPSCHVRITRHN